MQNFPQLDQNYRAAGEYKEKYLFGAQLQQLVDVFESITFDSYRSRQIYHALYRQRISSVDELATLPKSIRRQLSEAGYTVGLPTIARTFRSSDGTERYLVACPDGETIETVWMPNGDDGERGDGSDAAAEEAREPLPPGNNDRSKSDVILSEAKELAFLRLSENAQEENRVIPTPSASLRGNSATRSGETCIPPAQPELAEQYRRATICVSSQVGCAVNCHFCLTAKLGVKRNLTAGEIAGQVVAVLNRHQVQIGRDRINIVFMGMGEPFLNYDNFMAAVHLLVEGVGIPESRMTVSTSGILPGIERFAKEKLRPKLALSLNAPNDAIRERIMPITRKWNIAALLSALREIPFRPRQYITFEYVLLGGVNDRLEDARELASVLRSSGLPCKVNLIVWNPGPDIPYKMPAPEDLAAFHQHLVASGIPTFTRRPRGRDIYAACGQLKRTVK